MEFQNLFSAKYTGTKSYDQWEVKTANATGFGAAADHYMERGIDLNEQLIRNKPATFFMKSKSSSMQKAGIDIGDVVVVDRSITAKNGKIVIAVVDGEMMIRRLEKSFSKLTLISECAERSAMEISEFQNCEIWGVVTYVIKDVS